VDFYTRYPFGPLRNYSGKQKAFSLIKPVGDAITAHRLESAVSQNNFQFIAGSGIFVESGLQIGLYIFKHNCSF
jgi:hypothetical protein